MWSMAQDYAENIWVKELNQLIKTVTEPKIDPNKNY
jgi:hypothetical protein